MELKLTVVEGDRRREAFSTRVMNWRFRITTGPRCSGMISNKLYSSVDSALRAGERMVEKIVSHT
jgi:hypothetical protein